MVYALFEVFFDKDTAGEFDVIQEFCPIDSRLVFESTICCSEDLDCCLVPLSGVEVLFIYQDGVLSVKKINERLIVSVKGSPRLLYRVVRKLNQLEVRFDVISVWRGGVR